MKLRDATISYRTILRILGAGLAVRWVVALNGIFQSGSGFGGMGDGAGSQRDNSDGAFLGVLLLVFVVPFVYAVAGPEKLSDGKAAATMRWYANIALGLATFVLVLLLRTKDKAAIIVALGAFLYFWNVLAEAKATEPNQPPQPTPPEERRG